MPLVAIGFTIVCAVCVFAAPTQVSYNGTNVPAGLSKTGFEHWANDHPTEVICNFNYHGGSGIVTTSSAPTPSRAMAPGGVGR